MLLNIPTLLIIKPNYGGDYLNLSYVTHGTVYYPFVRIYNSLKNASVIHINKPKAIETQRRKHKGRGGGRLHRWGFPQSQGGDIASLLAPSCSSGHLHSMSMFHHEKLGVQSHISNKTKVVCPSGGWIHLQMISIQLSLQLRAMQINFLWWLSLLEDGK